MQRIQINQSGLIVVLFIIFIVLYNWFSYSYNVNINSDVNSISVKSLLATSVVLVERAGQKIKKIHESKNLSIKKKKVKGLVLEEILTGADISSHNLLTTGFSNLFSDIQVVSEEKSSKSGQKPAFDFLISPDVMVMKSITHDFIIKSNDLTIWIDPLDATQEFTENLLQYVTVMVCVVFQGNPIAGVIHYPFDNKTYWAWKGRGMSSNLNTLTNRPIKSSYYDKIKIIVSRSHAGSVNTSLQKLLGPDIEVVFAGGSGHKVMQVIKGKHDCYYHETPIKKWDLCAPQAIIEAAGGSLTDLKGKRIHYQPNSNPVVKSGVLATLNKTLHSTLIAKLSHRF